MTLLPEAVIEIISKDYEAKDTLVGVPFYVTTPHGINSGGFYNDISLTACSPIPFCPIRKMFTAALVSLSSDKPQVGQ